MTYKIVSLFGDFYYKPMSFDEAFTKGFQMQTDPSQTFQS